jgi:4-amino-4-deoxy-L-arabinose transferase-like glycosyltransferase
MASTSGYDQLAPADPDTAGGSGVAGAAGPGGLAGPGGRLRHPVLVHLAVLAGYLVAGIVASWPRATYLVEGKLPATRDAGSYVWDFWWVAHQVAHLSNPWFTRAIDAPVGTQLGLHALMPLPGVLLAPVTFLFGPSASYNLLSIALPGLLCYAAYRVARLWLPSQTGAIAAGAFFGLSSMLVWRSWYHLNLAAGELFIPIALEAAVRLTRRPGWRQAVILGVVLGAAVLTDQEIAVLVIIAAVLALLAWLLWPPLRLAKLRAAALAAVVTVVLASPQLAAIVQQVRSGGATTPPVTLAKNYIKYSARLPGIIAPSPQISHFGLGHLGFIYTGPTKDGIPSFGLVLTILAVLGVLAGWRRRSTWLLALLWLGCAALALGPVLRIGGHLYAPAPEVLGGRNLSRLMPFTWFAKLPGLSGFREPDRIMMLGILPAALLAGAVVDWLRYHFAPAIVVVAALAVLEAGWSGNANIGTMHTALPAVDRPIAADHSGSIVVDVPFGIRGGTYGYGLGFDPEAQVLATADGHPRSVGYISRVPRPTINGIRRHPFYAQLAARQHQGGHSTASRLAAARADARRMHIGWALVWVWNGHGANRAVLPYLRAVGFRFAYQADGVSVYRLGS